MPWTAADASKHDTDADTPKKKRQWAHVANKMLKKTGSKSRAIRAASSTVEATLYRDPDYGALALIERDGGLLEVHTHGFMDYAPVERLLTAQAQPIEESDTGTLWSPRVQRAILTTSIDRALRDGGYRPDPLGERAILRVSEEEALYPDLPAAGHARVSEAVERAISQQLDTALSRAQLPGAVLSGMIEAFPRPHTQDSMGRNLPFFRARAEVQLAGTVDEGACTAAWREALAGLGENLVRATARVDGRVLVLEAGVRPRPEVIETFESLALPAFEQAPISGYREVHIQLQSPLTEDELTRIRERAEACTAATALEAIEPTLLLAHVPSMIEGQHLGDRAFRERINWLVQECQAGGGELGWVGLMRNSHGVFLGESTTSDDEMVIATHLLWHIKDETARNTLARKIYKDLVARQAVRARHPEMTANDLRDLLRAHVSAVVRRPSELARLLDRMVRDLVGRDVVPVLESTSAAIMEGYSSFDKSYPKPAGGYDASRTMQVYQAVKRATSGIHGVEVTSPKVGREFVNARISGFNVAIYADRDGGLYWTAWNSDDDYDYWENKPVTLDGIRRQFAATADALRRSRGESVTTDAATISERLVTPDMLVAGGMRLTKALGEAYMAAVDLKLMMDTAEEIPNTLRRIYDRTGKIISDVADLKGTAYQSEMELRRTYRR